MNGTNTHSIVVGYILWAFGFFGLHRFYYGRQITGVIWALTLGLLFVGWIVDFFLIPAMDQQCNRRYRTGPLNYSIAWILLLIPLTGITGLHRFYMGKWVTGLIWLLTGSLIGLGFIYDLLSLNEQVDEINGQYLIEGRA